MNIFIIKFAIGLSYFMMDGLATTNILRLTTGNALGIFSSKCFCPNCNMKITPLNQTPIFSYIVNKGKCKKCHNPIPKYALLLEIIIFLGMLIITAIFHFRPFGVLISFVYYEIIRIIYIVWFGKREKQFWKQYFFAILGMVVHFLLIGFMSLLGCEL